MNTIRGRRYRGILASGLVAATIACAAPPQAPAASDNDAARALPAMLAASAEAWNTGDLDGHVAPYTGDATFMTGKGPIAGSRQVRESLERSFWRDGKPTQQLAFDQITVRPLGDRHALVTGHFVLSGGGEPDRSGWFSLTCEQTPAGWRIMHDHSS